MNGKEASKSVKMCVRGVDEGGTGFSTLFIVHFTIVYSWTIFLYWVSMKCNVSQPGPFGVSKVTFQVNMLGYMARV